MWVSAVRLHSRHTTVIAAKTQTQLRFIGNRARACRKLRSLFISANFRKQDCSSCQAATPSRVAASASLGT